MRSLLSFAPADGLGMVFDRLCFSGIEMDQRVARRQRFLTIYKPRKPSGPLARLASLARNRVRCRWANYGYDSSRVAVFFVGTILMNFMRLMRIGLRCRRHSIEGDS